MIGSIRVGHYSDPKAVTGCTVFLAPEGTVGSCEVRGAAPATLDTQHLRPTFLVDRLDAVLLSGGSAFGLATTAGVTAFLKEAGVGLPTPGGPVPLVSAACIFDLDLGEPLAPDAEAAYQACRNAEVDNTAQGCVGVGMGATVGNALGRVRSTKSGFGLYRFMAEGFRLEVAAVANAFGEVVGADGKLLAGARGRDERYVSTEKAICSNSGREELFRANTTLVVVATNARLDREGCARLALQGHNGIARAIRPSHTRYDGDTVFVMATGEVEASPDALEVITAGGTAEAIREGVMRASPAAGIPCACDILEG